jgi:hypothetical protein
MPLMADSMTQGKWVMQTADWRLATADWKSSLLLRIIQPYDCLEL